MRNIQLEGRTIEKHYGRNVDTAPALLERWKKGEGVIPSEADIRFYGTQNQDVRDMYFDTSTLSATRGEDVKVILPYENGSRELTDAAEFGLSLINPSERLVNYGVNLDVDGRWAKLEGSGVYTLQRKGLILNEDLTEAQAMNHALLLMKLGHPDLVDGKFARSRDEVAEIIGNTFESGRNYFNDRDVTMMGQYLPGVSDKGVLKAWFVYRLDGRARSCARTCLDDVSGGFAFDSVGDTMNDAVGVGEGKSQTLEGRVGENILSAINSGSAFEHNGVLYVPISWSFICFN